MEAFQMSSDTRMNKENAVCTHNGILYDLKKEGNLSHAPI
jgi:hypothetical protein